MPQPLSQYINMGCGRLNSQPRVYYTTPEGRSAVLREVLLCNPAGEQGGVHLWVVPPGGACSPENQYLSQAIVERDETRFVTLALSLPPGWSLYLAAPYGSMINAVASGLEVSNV